MPAAAYQSSPPKTTYCRLSFPTQYVLLVTLSRPKSLNCINRAGNEELSHVWAWLDEEPSLRVGVITGEGRAFCAGADLKEWNDSNPQTSSSSVAPPASATRSSGFGGISRRSGKKPVIAAVNGLAHGGGCEIVAGCDLVLASPSAVFALPEVKRGVVAIAGALPRLAHTLGRNRAMEMALTGRNVSARQAQDWGLCNAIAERDGDGDIEGGVLQLALRWAQEVANNSPDAVIVSKKGVDFGWERGDVEESTQELIDVFWKELEKGENITEGIRAFVEKRNPKWVPSKL